MRNVAKDIFQIAETHAGKTALVTPHATYTYADLHAQTERLAGNVLTLGIRPGDRAGLCLDDTAEHVILYIALARLGVMVIPMDHRWSREEKANIAHGFEADVIIAETRDAMEHSARTLTITDITQDRDLTATLPPFPSGDTPFMVSLSSGTTGTPKGAHVLHRHMCARFDVHQSTLGFSAQSRYLSLTPLCMGAGRSFALGTLAAGGCLYLYPSATAPRAIPSIVKSHNINLMFAPPSLLRQLLALHHTGNLLLPTLARLIVSGAPLYPAERAAVTERITPHLTILYATSEGGAVCALEGGAACALEGDALTAHPDSVGRLVPDVMIDIVDENDHPLPRNTIGRLRYKGPGVTLEMAQGRSCETKVSDKVKDGWFYPDDLAEQNDEGFIFLRGRAKEMINVGGVNVYPNDIEQALLTHPDVCEATALGAASSIHGEQIVAFVATSSKALTARDLQHHLRPLLAAYKLPKRYIVLDALPKNAMGKVIKAKLLDKLEEERNGVVSSTSNALQARKHHIKLHVLKLWESILNTTALSQDLSFFENGGTSQTAVDLLLHIEDTFGKSLPMDALWAQKCTIDHLTDLIADENFLASYPRLVPIKATGTRPPLFCVHTLGGNLFHYYPLADHLDADQPLYGLQAKGVYGGEQPDMTIEEIARDCITTMQSHQAEGPYRIIGFSSGGMIAYEMAQQLRDMGQDPSLLMMIDTTLPHASLLTALLKKMGRTRDGDLPLHIQEKLDFYLRSLFRIKKQKAYTNIGAIQRRAYWSYKPQSYTGEVDLVVASTPKMLTEKQTLGWDRYAQGNLLIHPVLGQHNEMVKYPAIALIADVIETRMRNTEVDRASASIGLADTV